MHPMIASAMATLRTAFDGAVAAASRLDRRTLAWGGLALAAVTFLCVNLIATTAFRSARLDVTKDGLYTISEGTRRSLATIGEPIDIRIYFSKKLGDAAPQFAKSFERVRTLLEQYRAISGGKLQVTYLDPEAFSEAEDRAVAAGLRGIRLNQEGDLGYFGLAGTNSTDNEASIPFFAAERERFIEYDVTKLVHSLANPKKRLVGLLTSLPLDGGMDPMMGMRGRPLPPQMVMEQIRELFEVKTLERGFKEVPADIDVLMIVQPDQLPPETVYAIDQFALKGGKVLAFVDPVAETQRASGPMGLAGAASLGDFDKVLKAWGVAYDPGKVAGDISLARRVQFGGGPRGGTVTEYVVWLGLDKAALDQKDVLSGGIERINVASAGFLGKLDGATTTVAPILQTSVRAMAIEAEKASAQPDAVALLRGYKIGGKPLMLAARVVGDAKTAFPDGAPQPPKADAAKDGKAEAETPGADPAADAKAAAAKAENDKAQAAKAAEDKAAAAKAAEAHRASGKVNVVLVADTDMLNDSFWVDVREFMGQQVAVPNAHNAAFVLGALENLSGSDALISLRGRGVADRPFEMVADIRREAERKFRDKEQALTAKLKDVQDQLAKLEASSSADAVILADKDRQAIEKFRVEMLDIRRELRDVKLALRRDIDRLDGWLKFANIALVPLLMGAGAVGFGLWRRRQRPA